MKILFIICLIFGGYQYYASATASPISSGIAIIDKVRLSSVPKQEVIDLVLDQQYAHCQQAIIKSDLEHCTYQFNYNKPFCLKLFNIDAPAAFTSEPQLKQKMTSLETCMENTSVY